MIKIIREDCQYFIEQMNKLFENDSNDKLRIVQEGGEEARKDINEIFSTWGKNEIYACTLSNQSSYQFDARDFKDRIRRAYVAKLGDNPVGFVFLDDYNENGANVTIGVKNKDEFKNKGIASKLAMHLLDWFDSKSNNEYENLYWGNLDNNIASSKIADKFDFKPYKKIRATIQGDEIMLKSRSKKPINLKPIPKECIKSATLVDKDEVEKIIPEELRNIRKDKKDMVWWLKGDCDKRYGYCNDACAFAFNGSGVGIYGTSWDSPVRPILMLSNIKRAKLDIGDSFKFGGCYFEVISNDKAFCRSYVGECPFRKDSRAEDGGEYDKSDIKKYVEEWFEKAYSSYKDEDQEK